MVSLRGAMIGILKWIEKFDPATACSIYIEKNPLKTVKFIPKDISPGPGL